MGWWLLLKQSGKVKVNLSLYINTMSWRCTGAWSRVISFMLWSLYTQTAPATNCLWVWTGISQSGCCEEKNPTPARCSDYCHEGSVKGMRINILTHIWPQDLQLTKVKIVFGEECTVLEQLPGICLHLVWCVTQLQVKLAAGGRRVPLVLMGVD
jgi:hypothetical protein